MFSIIYVTNIYFCEGQNNFFCDLKAIILHSLKHTLVYFKSACFFFFTIVKKILSAIKIPQTANELRFVQIILYYVSILWHFLPGGPGADTTKTYTEEDWMEPEKLNAYGKSKTLAEKAAWDYVKELPGTSLPPKCLPRQSDYIVNFC